MSFNGDLYPTAGADVVMTTKGDMVDYNTARQRLGIGSANQILQVKSGLPSWETLSTAGSVLTTQGDILYEGASGLSRLGFGTSGDVLTTKGTGANPVWETASASGRLEQLASYVETGSEDTATMTFSSIDLDDYSALMVTGSGVSVGAFNLQMTYAPVTSGYRYNYDKSANGTWTNVTATGQSEWILNDFGVGEWFGFQAWIYPFEDNEGGDEAACQWRVSAFETDQFFGSGFTQSGGFDITNVELTTSTSNWYINTRFNVMGLNRA